MASMEIGVKRPKGGNERPVRIYTYGVYDLFHLGHMRAFERYKDMYPRSHLIVGILDDQPSAMTLEERALAIKCCRWVDEVISPCPPSPTTDFLDSYSIHLVVVPNTDPLPQNNNNPLGSHSTLGVDEKELHLRVIREKNSYAVICLRKGYAPKQLNLSPASAFALQSAEYPLSLVRKVKRVAARMWKVGKRLEQWIGLSRDKTGVEKHP